MLDVLTPPRQRVLIGVAVVVLVAGIVLVVAGGDEGDDVSTDASSSTTSPSTSTTTSPSTTAPVTTAASATTVVPPPTTTAEPAPATTESAPPPATVPVPLGDVRVALTPVASLSEPVAMAARPGDGELWVAEQGGRVVALRGGQPVTTVDVSADTESRGEQGLLGIAFSADGSRLYLSYTDNAGDSHVDGLAVAGDGTVDVDSRRQVLVVDQPFGNHNGGHVLLGPDDAIWLGLGDGGSGGDPDGHAQRDGDPLGKLLRLGPGASSFEIVAKGLRNPWRFSFDRANDDLWLADVGQSSLEEVNRVPFAAVAGADFGWDRMEGTQPFEGSPREGDVAPVHEYPTSDGCAVTGGFVYRGSAIPALVGTYVFADYCAGDVRGLRLDRGGGIEEGSIGASVSQLASFGEDLAGELYVLSRSGTVFRLDPA